MLAFVRIADRSPARSPTPDSRMEGFPRGPLAAGALDTESKSSLPFQRAGETPSAPPAIHWMHIYALFGTVSAWVFCEPCQSETS